MDEIEKEFEVKILYAVESGSRGWGFANEDSDYDVRFIYVRKLEDYVSCENIRDVIDIQDLKNKKYKYDLDFSGWDIKKALNLHRKSNPSLREHIVHTMVYRGDTSFFEGLPDFDLVALKAAYGGMTYSNWKKYVKGEDMTPRVTKRYCYCIRQILAWILIDEDNDPEAPVNIDELFKRFEGRKHVIGDQLMEDMHTLIDYYRSGCKLNRLSERAILSISKFISVYLDVMKTPQGKKAELPDIEIYNQRFRDILVQIVPYGLRSDYWDRCHNCEHDNSFPSCTWCEKDYYDGIDSYILEEHYCQDFKPSEIYKSTRKKVGF